ncbi:MAG: hypothetical protein QMD65_00410 [Patescibacteria group bacterium]|nr:hypothetical protein [Patescibacteria group bacterium]
MKKSNFISALMFLIDVLSRLFKEVKKLGGTEDVFYSLKDESKIQEIARILVGKAEKKILQFLRLISAGESIILDSVDGSETLYDATDVFAYRDSDFKNYGANKKGLRTEATPVQVYEMVKDATFAQMFGSLSSDLNALCFTQSQIKNFAKKHRHWFKTDGCSMFFLFKSNNQFFVTYVYVHSDSTLDVNVNRFENGNVWNAEFRYRLVVPQLAV